MLAARTRVPRRDRPAHAGWAILALAMGGFAIGTTEFVTMGVLPEIAAGRCFFAFGMSERDTGSDLASV